MAISSLSAIRFFGTQDTVTATGGTAAVTDTSYSVTGDGVSGGWTNDDDAPLVSAVLKFQYATGTIDTNGVKLYCRQQNVDATGDEPVIDSGYTAHLLDTFVTDSGQATSTDTYYTVGPVELPANAASQVYDFFIQNDCGVTLASGWTVKVTPVTVGPHA